MRSPDRADTLDFYAGSRSLWICRRTGAGGAGALGRQGGLMDQLCVNTATWGLQYWEKTLGIPVEQGKDLEYRRSRIRSKLRGSGVTTVALIESVAESFSNGDVAVTEYPASTGWRSSSWVPSVFRPIWTT